jgi:hypothetical protein
MKRPGRVPSHLCESLHKRLNAYALAASAAGVSTLALSQASQAKIVYTPAHVVLHARSSAHYYIDLNHDGVKDFTFSHGYFYSATSAFWGSIVQMQPYKSNGGRIMGGGYPMALPKGIKVGPSDRFSHYGIMAWARGTGRSQNTMFAGSWANDGKGTQNRYLGLSFTIKGKTHYGWARLNVSKFRFAATLTGYAYETVPNKAIITGKTKGPDVITMQPATLGHLAAGASAIPAWRTEPAGGTH